MTAATKTRDTQEVTKRLRHFPMAAGAKVFGGTMAIIDSGNNVNKGITATGHASVGVFAQDYDNTGGAAGAIRAEVKIGVFGPFANSSGGDLIETKHIGGSCYIVDDSTVAKGDGTGTRTKIQGKVHDVDANGVWVDFT